MSSWEKKAVLLIGVWRCGKKILSLLKGKICTVFDGFNPSKEVVCFDFVPDPLKSAEIFSFSATLHRQNMRKEIAYKMTSYQFPFKSAHIFVFNSVIKDNKK